MRNAAAKRGRVDWRRPADFGAHAGDWRKGSWRTEAWRLVQVAAAGNRDSSVRELVASGGLPEFRNHSTFEASGQPARAADVFVDFGEYTRRNSAGVCDATGRAFGAVRGCTCRRHLFDLRHTRNVPMPKKSPRPKTDPKEADFSTFHYHACAHAFSGQFTRPFHDLIEVQAATALPIIGGHGNSRVSNFQFREFVTFKHGYTHVSGAHQED